VTSNIIYTAVHRSWQLLLYSQMHALAVCKQPAFFNAVVETAAETPALDYITVADRSPWVGSLTRQQAYVSLLHM
jgi:hypothetical protein